MSEFINRCFHEPDKSYFLFGPRGTGKSTYLRNKHKNNTIWIDLLRPDEYRSYFARPERLYEIIPAKQKISTIIIDEIQRAPGLLTVVHSLIEGRLGVVVTFLALLELLKQSLIEFVQAAPFAPIYLKSKANVL